MDVEFDRDFGFAGADVAVGAGRIQDTRDQQLLPQVGTLVQEDLEQRKTNTDMKCAILGQSIQAILTRLLLKAKTPC